MRHRIFCNVILALILLIRIFFFISCKGKMDAMFEVGDGLPAYVTLAVNAVEWLPVITAALPILANVLPVPADIVLNDFNILLCVITFLIELLLRMYGSWLGGPSGSELPILDVITAGICLYCILCSRRIRNTGEFY
jgi:hypothetical protein